MPGIMEFYLERIKAARGYGPRAADDINELVIRCTEYDYHSGLLTHQQFQIIMKAADDLHYDIMTGGLNDGNCKENQQEGQPGNHLGCSSGCSV